MNELDDFLTPTLTRQLQAEQALINGDPGPRLAMWSTQDPVTVFGRDRTTIGSEEVTQAFHWLATRFSNLTDYRFELVAAGASGDLAYTLGYEHITFSIDGGPVEPITLRVTHLYRREDGEWKTVHRHADDPPTGPLPFRRHIDGVGVPARGQGRAGATSHLNVTDNTGHQRSGNLQAQQLPSVSITGPGTTPVLSPTEAVEGLKRQAARLGSCRRGAMRQQRQACRQLHKVRS